MAAIVYVAGPYSSDPEKNTLAAMEAGHKLMDIGLSPIVPHLSHYMNAIRLRDYEDWMRIDFDFVRRSDAVLRLPGASSGADREVELAISLNIPVFSSIEDVARWSVDRQETAYL